MICWTSTKQKTRKNHSQQQFVANTWRQDRASLAHIIVCVQKTLHRPSTKPNTVCWLEAPTRGQIILVRWWSLTITVINIWTVSHETTGINQTYRVFLKMHKISMRDVICFFPIAWSSSTFHCKWGHHHQNKWLPIAQLLDSWHSTQDKCCLKWYFNHMRVGRCSTQAHWSHEHKICCEVSEQETISWPFDVRHDETRWILVHSFDAGQMSCN